MYTNVTFPPKKKELSCKISEMSPIELVFHVVFPYFVCHDTSDIWASI